VNRTTVSSETTILVTRTIKHKYAVGDTLICGNGTFLVRSVGCHAKGEPIYQMEQVDPRQRTFLVAGFDARDDVKVIA
jgi:hypothetical protein